LQQLNSGVSFQWLMLIRRRLQQLKISFKFATIPVVRHVRMGLFLPVRVCWVAVSMFDFRLSTTSSFRRLVGHFALIFAHTVGSTCNLSVSPWGVVPTVDR
jgi:hypothetical protein